MRLAESLTKKDYTIYVDMDGVLADFLKGAGLATDMTFKTHMDWEKVKKVEWKTLADMGADFWAGLPWNKGGKKLWSFVRQYNPNILSAFPQAQENKQHAINGKKRWIKRELTGVNKIHIVRGQEKQDYAEPTAILIDDSPRNIDQFNAKGGIGILHKNTNDTIKQLKAIIRNEQIR